jgi:hypothetical protein
MIDSKIIPPTIHTHVGTVLVCSVVVVVTLLVALPELAVLSCANVIAVVRLNIINEKSRR